MSYTATTRNSPFAAVIIVASILIAAFVGAPHTAAGRQSIEEFKQIPASIQTDIRALLPTPPATQPNALATSDLDAGTKSDLAAQGATHLVSCDQKLGSELTQAFADYGDPLVCAD